MSLDELLCPCLTNLPGIRTSSAGSSEKKVWITTIPPLFFTVSSQTKADPVPISMVINVTDEILDALEITSSLFGVDDSRHCMDTNSALYSEFFSNDHFKIGNLVEMMIVFGKNRRCNKSFFHYFII